MVPCLLLSRLTRLADLHLQSLWWWTLLWRFAVLVNFLQFLRRGRYRGLVERHWGVTLVHDTIADARPVAPSYDEVLRVVFTSAATVRRSIMAVALGDRGVVRVRGFVCGFVCVRVCGCVCVVRGWGMFLCR